MIMTLLSIPGHLLLFTLKGKRESYDAWMAWLRFVNFPRAARISTWQLLQVAGGVLGKGLQMEPRVFASPVLHGTGEGALGGTRGACRRRTFFRKPALRRSRKSAILDKERSLTEGSCEQSACCCGARGMKEQIGFAFHSMPTYVCGIKTKKECSLMKLAVIVLQIKFWG